MPRKAAITPNTHLHTTLPPELGAKLQLFLYSEVEGRIPQGAYQRFICDRLIEFFDSRQVDISFLLGQLPGTSFARCRRDTAEALTRLLNGKVTP